MNLYKLDRIVEYNGITYKIIETLTSEMLLVVDKEEFEKGVFPLNVKIIPGE